LGLIENFKCLFPPGQDLSVIFLPVCRLDLVGLGGMTS
jgi:hypothetical protein